jgi:hypothetical protein
MKKIASILCFTVVATIPLFNTSCDKDEEMRIMHDTVYIQSQHINEEIKITHDTVYIQSQHINSDDQIIDVEDHSQESFFDTYNRLLNDIIE